MFLKTPWPTDYYPTNGIIIMNSFKHLIDEVKNDDEYTRMTAVDSIKLVYQVSSRIAIDIGNEFFMKSGSNISFEEVTSMDLVRRETNIPIPSVVRHWRFNNTNFILMEKVKGRLLNDVWGHLSYDERCMVSDNVSDVIMKMRGIRIGSKVLIHGDLIPLNIFIDNSTLNILSIIDWETCRFSNEDDELDIMKNNPDAPHDWYIMITSSLVAHK